MEKLYSTVPVKLATRDLEEEGLNAYSESVYLFKFDNEDEAEEFQILSHNEQLKLCGFKEEATPSKGTIHRYIIDASDYYVVIRETVMSW